MPCCGRKPRSAYDRQPRPCQFVAFVAYFLAAAVLVSIIITATSFHKVDESEACILTNTYRGTTDFEPYTSASRIAASPWHELICYRTTIQNLQFREGRGGLERSLTVRASDGLNIVLEMEVDVRVRPERVGDIIRLFDKDALNQVRRIVRSSARNAAATFATASFLTGERVDISAAILTAIQAELNGIFIDALRVNLLLIVVPEGFLTRFEAVERVRLDVREEVERLPTRRASVERRNQTGIVDLEAARRTSVIAAERDVTAARLAQLNALVTEETRQQQVQVQEETDRVVRVTAANTAVERAVAEASLNVSIARLQEEQRELEASRQRTITIAQAQRQVAEARAAAAAQVAAAQTELETSAVQQATRQAVAFAEADRTEVEAAGEAAGITARGEADAAVLREATTADLAYLVGAAANGWSETQAGAGLHFRTIRTVLANATAFLDYERKPLSLEVQGDGDVSALGSVNVP